mmetsp:Transcript_36670/g.82460  ORF Transcript_36670/g.82460 Transcript_36670/m.82460 type:complete len:200 (-) Transcript_36670:901-1500(-)
MSARRVAYPIVYCRLLLMLVPISKKFENVGLAAIFIQQGRRIGSTLVLVERVVYPNYAKDVAFLLPRARASKPVPASKINGYGLVWSISSSILRVATPVTTPTLTRRGTNMASSPESKLISKIKTRLKTSSQHWACICSEQDRSSLLRNLHTPTGSLESTTFISRQISRTRSEHLRLIASFDRSPTMILATALRALHPR